MASKEGNKDVGGRQRKGVPTIVGTMATQTHTVARLPTVSSIHTPTALGSIGTTTNNGTRRIGTRIVWVDDHGRRKREPSNDGRPEIMMRHCEIDVFVAWLRFMKANENIENAKDLKLRFCTISKNDWQRWPGPVAKVLNDLRALKLANVKRRAAAAKREFIEQNCVTPLMRCSSDGGITWTTQAMSTAPLHVNYYPTVKAWVERLQANNDTVGDLILPVGIIVWKKWLHSWVEHWLPFMQKAFAERYPVLVPE